MQFSHYSQFQVSNILLICLLEGELQTIVRLSVIYLQYNFNPQHYIWFAFCVVEQIRLVPCMEHASH
jgi:hypothetical protein